VPEEIDAWYGRLEERGLTAKRTIDRSAHKQYASATEPIHRRDATLTVWDRT